MSSTGETKICIEDIMREIREEIASKGLDSSMLSFEDIKCGPSSDYGADMGEEDYQRSLSYINLNYKIEPYKPLYGNGLFVFVKKVLRKLMKFYIEPVIAEQSVINEHYVRLFNYMNSAGNNDAELSEVRRRLDEYENRMNNIMEYNRTLEERIEVLEKENTALRKNQSPAEE